MLADQSTAGKKKNRNDHRHHAIDAAVIAVTNQGLINKIATESGQLKNNNPDDVIGKINPPWKTFRCDLRAKLNQIIVSHRNDHGRISFEGRKSGRDSTSSQLHNDTAYGLTDEVNDKGIPIVVTRKPLASLKPADISRIRDSDLLAQLYQHTEGLEGKEFTKSLTEFSAKDGPYCGIRRVRLTEPLNVIKIKDKQGNAYKGYKGNSNHCIEVWRLPNGKWKAEILTTFNAHHDGLGATRPHPAAKLLIRLFKKDVVILNHAKAGKKMAIIVKFCSANLVLASLNEANANTSYKKKDDPFKYINVGLGTFEKTALRKVHINELGHIKDTPPNLK